MVRLLLLLLAPAIAAADPTVQVAQAHFARGAQLYAGQRYAEAIEEFEQARRYAPLPAFDYNIARCQERLGENAAAITAYERYLTSNPPDADDIRRRISRLRAPPPPSLAPPPPASLAPLPPPPVEAVAPTSAAPADARRGLRVGAGVLLGGSVALFAAGIGLTASVGPAIDDLLPTCLMRQCGPADTDGLHQRQDAGWALIGIAGAALVVDVALFVVAYRKPRARFAQAALTW